ncbi:dihydrofolate reductase family protein [Ensifer adhaerens]|uniref:dihydrofolate reductase family protein n=1 Tax=Ensifer adhaerens TaxID=106592 RepID=UPI00132EE280|nr:RibD family protein [Ensifer adhaerens]QHG74733.1 RibD family protein [Ensifer adhaerens]
MKPYVTVHMGSSIDGRIVTDHWPKAMTATLSEVYERIHERLKADAWMVGRVTMACFARDEPRPVKATTTYPRTNWRAPDAGAGPYAVAVDQGGTLHLNRNDISGDRVILILVESVSDDHLAELRRDGISYIFAGQNELDLGSALDILHREFGIETIVLEGGGIINGSLLAAGLIDEISLLILPIADGGQHVSVFEKPLGLATLLSLKSVEKLESDIVHLVYQVTK